jgi:hypothetical protein
MQNITLTIDFESVGGVPSVNGFTKLGAAFVDQDETVIATFSQSVTKKTNDALMNFGKHYPIINMKK